MTKEKDFDLDNFFATRQELASRTSSVYAHRQLSAIRSQVQELRVAELEAKAEAKAKTKPKGGTE